MSVFRIDTWNARHFANTEAFAARIDQLYQTLIRKISQLTAGMTKPSGKVFSFTKYPAVQEQVDTLLRDFAAQMQVTIQAGMEAEWNLADLKNDAFVESVLGTSSLPRSAVERYMGRNVEALNAFQNRKVAGLGLSDRVWKYTKQFRTELELALEVGLGEGRSAEQLSRDIRGYLNEPERLFRRVRNQNGQLVLSKAARAYNPGRGVYRSSYKNAMRLARTEINMAYREADYLRFQELDFVVGIEIKRSNNPYPCPVCEKLVGRYPKWFKFRGFHPNCRCYVVSILATPDEMERMTQSILNGQTPNISSANTISNLPEQFTQWVQDNQSRFTGGASVPLFLSDNFGKKNLLESIARKEVAFTPIAQPAVPITPVIPVAQQLRDAGYFVNGTDEVVQATYEKVMSGFDLPALRDDIDQLLMKKGLTLSISDATFTGDSVKLFFNAKTFSGDFFFLERDFSLVNGRRQVKHTLFQLSKSLQGGGMSKELFQSLYKQYQAGGIELLSVHANIDVGGYTWAKYGFTFKDQTHRNMVYNRAIRMLKGDELPKFKVLWEKIKDETLFPLHVVADSPWGKKILLGSDWYGLLDLADPTQKKLFEDYLFRR